MSTVKAKQIRHFLRLTYPLRVVAADSGFKADYPDLPGCSLIDDNLPQLYATLEQFRRHWITERVLAGDAIPLPNSHLMDACAAIREEETVGSRLSPL